MISKYEFALTSKRVDDGNRQALEVREGGETVAMMTYGEAADVLLKGSHASAHDELVERLVALAASISVGIGQGDIEPRLTMGSMISKRQRDRPRQCVAKPNATERSGSAAAKLVYRRICQEEVFGPVLSISKFGDRDDPIEMANGSDCQKRDRCPAKIPRHQAAMARRLRGGQVFVNEWFAGGAETPFGGIGKSGYGREKGREGLRNYVQTKNIAIRLRSPAEGLLARSSRQHSCAQRN